MNRDQFGYLAELRKAGEDLLAAQRPARPAAVVEDFQRMAAEVSGQDLNGFFQAWLYTPGRPAATADNGIAGLPTLPRP